MTDAWQYASLLSPLKNNDNDKVNVKNFPKSDISSYFEVRHPHCVLQIS